MSLLSCQHLLTLHVQHGPGDSGDRDLSVTMYPNLCRVVVIIVENNRPSEQIPAKYA